MDVTARQLAEKLEEDIGRWEDAARFLEDPRILDLEDLGGTKQSARQVAQAYRERAKEWRDLLDRLQQE